MGFVNEKRLRNAELKKCYTEEVLNNRLILHCLSDTYRAIADKANKGIYLE